MARNATRLKQGSGWDSSRQKASHDKRLAQKTRKDSFAGKVFEDLSPKERNLLLKAVAIRLNMIVESPD